MPSDKKLVNELFAKGEAQKAKPVLKDIIRSNPQDEQAYIFLAQLETVKSKRIKLYKKIIELNPHNINAKKTYELLMGIRPVKNIPGFLREIEHQDRLIPSGILNDESPSGAPAKSKKTDLAYVQQGNETATKKVPPAGGGSDRQHDIQVGVVKPINEDNQKAKRTAKRKKVDANTIESYGNSDQANSLNAPELKLSAEEPNFFHGCNKGVDVISRLETGIFGKKVFVGGLQIPIHDDNAPPCIEVDFSSNEPRCDFCEYFNPDNCLLRYDEYLLEDIQFFTNNRVKRIEDYQQKKQMILDGLYRELKNHGTPLHYKYLANMMVKRYPKLNLNSYKVMHYLFAHQNLFKRVDQGVFRAS